MTDKPTITITDPEGTFASTWEVHNRDTLAGMFSRLEVRQRLGTASKVTEPDPQEHTFLVAVTVTTPYNREEAERWLHTRLNHPGFRATDNAPSAHVSEWWIAEDDRHDRTDNWSAVFVPPPLEQTEARAILQAASRANQLGVDLTTIKALLEAAPSFASRGDLT